MQKCTETVITRCLESLRSAPGAKKQPKVIGVGMDVFSMSILAVDGAGHPISEVFTYADSRAAPHAAQLRRQLGEAGQRLLWNITGTPIHTSYVVAHHLRLLAEKPDVCARYASRSSVHVTNITRINRSMCECVCLSRASQFRTLGAHLVGTWMGRGTSMPVSFSEASWT